MRNDSESIAAGGEKDGARRTSGCYPPSQFSPDCGCSKAALKATRARQSLADNGYAAYAGSRDFYRLKIPPRMRAGSFMLQHERGAAAAGAP